MNFFQILGAWFAANWGFVAALAVIVVAMQRAWAAANDPRNTWGTLGHKAAKFVVIFAFLIMVGFGLTNWALPMAVQNMRNSVATAGVSQVLANTLAAGQAILASPGGTAPVQAMEIPVVGVEPVDIVGDITSGLSNLQSGVSAAANKLVAPPVENVAPAESNSFVAPAANNNVQPAFVQPAPAGWKAPAVQGPVVPQQMPTAVPGPVINWQAAPAPTAAPAPAFDLTKPNFWKETYPNSAPANKPGSGGPTVYTVQSGDSMGKIAAKFNVPVNQLCKLNYQVVHNNCNVIRSGWVLTIPAQ